MQVPRPSFPNLYLPADDSRLTFMICCLRRSVLGVAYRESPPLRQQVGNAAVRELMEGMNWWRSTSGAYVC